MIAAAIASPPASNRHQAARRYHGAARLRHLLATAGHHPGGRIGCQHARATPGIVRLMGSVGDFSWPGASGTNWWADPHEELAAVWMAHSPGPIRWKYRQMINALVYQAIVD
jgi:CubicO group peptidase (beta-lactamase class C family)